MAYNDQKTAKDRIPWKYGMENKDKLFGLPISFPEQEFDEVVDNHHMAMMRESIHESYLQEHDRSEAYGD